MKSATRSASSTFLGTGASGAPLGGITKRGFDILAASMALVFLSPLFLLITLLVKMSDGGAVFYGHRRIGHNGRSFRCLKFRTMRMDGDRILQKHLKANPEAYDEWRKTRKLKDDPRVTVVGTVLRKLSLDELPQLFNILRGEMSIVGPRPPVPKEVEGYEPWQRRRLSVRPGLTCIWQVDGRNQVGFEQWMYLDMQYIDHWSLVDDFRLILKTIPVVLLGRGM